MNLFKSPTVAGIVVMFMVGSGYALPNLQIDISGGEYDILTETIMATSTDFTVYALAKNDMPITNINYSLVIAVTPQVESAMDLGSFTLDGEEILVTEDLTYGTPTNSFGTELPEHGIYDTYYFEKTFTFNSASLATGYNVADDPGGFEANSNGELYYQAFTFDISGLESGYGLHFDLYSEDGSKGKNGAIIFAPFSHDGEAQSVPEPTFFALFGLSFVFVAAFQQKIK